MFVTEVMMQCATHRVHYAIYCAIVDPRLCIGTMLARRNSMSGRLWWLAGCTVVFDAVTGQMLQAG